MFDTHTSAITREIAWISILLYTIALAYTLYIYKSWPKRVSSKRQNIFWLLYFVVFAITYAIDSDFFHYKEIVYSTKEVLDYGLERIYQHIILFVNNNYFLFRIIVFGGAVVAFYLLLAKTKIDKTVGLLLMLIIFGGYFCYARATLAFCIYYLGLYFIIKLKSHNSILKSITQFVFGISLVVTSFFFHRSMILLIALTPVALFKLGKKSLYSMLILFPLVLLFVRLAWGDIFALLAYDDVIENRMTGFYAEADDSVANWRGVLSNIINYGKYLLCFLFISRAVFRYKNVLDQAMLKLFSFYTVLSYVALICFPLFDGNIIYTHRFLKMTIVPVIILLTYLYKNNYMSLVRMRWLIYVSIAGSFLGFARYII